MTRAIVVTLGLALSIGTVLAQPAPDAPVGDTTGSDATGSGSASAGSDTQPPPTTDAGDGSGSGSDKQPITTEKANQDESLQTGGEERPWAKGVSKQQQDTALRLFSEANRALNTGLFAAALAKYKEALQSWKHPAIYYNMALAQMNLDQPLEVEKSMTKAIEYGAAPLEKDKYEHAKEYLVLNAKQLAWVDVSCKKVGANVLIDGEKAFTVEPGKQNRIKRRVRVGKHTIVAERTGYNAQVDAPYVEPGQTFRIELQLYTSEELTRYKTRWKQKWIPYAVLGSAVVFGGGAILLEKSAQTSYDNFDAEIARCNDASGGTGCMVDSSVSDLRSSGDTKKTLGYVGYGLAGAAIVAGGALLYLNRRVSYEITADEYRRELAQKKAPPVAVVPMVAPGSAGAMVLGRF